MEERISFIEDMIEEMNTLDTENANPKNIQAQNNQGLEYFEKTKSTNNMNRGRRTKAQKTFLKNHVTKMLKPKKETQGTYRTSDRLD